MALTRLARSSSSIDPLLQLAKIISDLLPHQGLPLIDKVRRWSDRLLVLAAILMGWADGSSLIDRFGLARASVVEIHPTRKRPGTGYNGFIDCLARHGTRLLQLLTAAFRKRLAELAGESYRTFGFVVFGADGTKIALPRSDSNIAHFGIANKKNSGPEMILCGLFHVATRSLWAFAHDVAHGSERALLASMLPFLPADSLVLADAGFVGWNTMTALIDAGQHFIIRGGANVRLLRNLGHIKEHDGIVHLWPDSKQKKKIPPIVLRCVMVRDGRGREMCLLTNVLDANRLSDRQIIQLYTLRWRVEVYFRDLKRSLGLQVISARTVAGVQKEILAFVLLYNLIRRVMLQAAKQQNTTADRISFIDALRWLLWSSPGGPIPKLKINTVRRRRSRPRRIKRGRHRFPQLHNSSRNPSKPPCEVRL